MTQRIKIASNSMSPFRVSASGVDVTGATFDGLLFDGNQKPLRIFSVGYVAANLMDGTTTHGLAKATNGPSTYSTPSGTYPLFTIVWKKYLAANPNLPLRTVGGTLGCGGTLTSSNQFQALNFDAGDPSDVSYVNYLIFKNYG